MLLPYSVVDVVTTCNVVLYCILHWQMLLPSLQWQILLPKKKLMADVIAILAWWMLLPLVIIICFISKVADVLAFICVVDRKTTRYLQIMLADVLAMVADGFNHPGWVILADVKAIVADGIITGQHYFNFSSEMFNRTSSQMCGRWNLPVFLFRDTLLALIYRASLMVLVRFWSSLPNILKFSMVTVWQEMLEWSYIGEGAFRCSLNLSPKFLADSPMYSSSHSSTLLHLYLYMTPLFLRIRSLSFEAMRRGGS